MARAQAVWNTIDTCNTYVLQVNQYDELRIIAHGRMVRRYEADRTTKGYGFWNTLKALHAN